MAVIRHGPLVGRWSNKGRNKAAWETT